MKDLFEQKAAQLATEIVGLCGMGGTGSSLCSLFHDNDALCYRTSLNFSPLFLNHSVITFLCSAELWVKTAFFAVHSHVFQWVVCLLKCKDHKLFVFHRPEVPLWWGEEPSGGCWPETGQTDWTAATREAGEWETPDRAGTVHHTMSFCWHFSFSHTSPQTLFASCVFTFFNECYALKIRLNYWAV